MGVKFNPFSSTLDVVDSPSGDFADVELDQGTAAAPSIAFTGDTNTGIYSPGADQVAISTNGTGRLFVDASGNVKVGNGGAIGALSVRTAVNGNFHLRDINSLAAGTGVAIDVLNDALSAVQDLAIRGTTTIFLNASGETMRITSDGKLGVGTSSPSALLHATGKLFIDATVADDVAASILNSSATGYGFRTQGGGGTGRYIAAFNDKDANLALIIDESRRVGIGTASPLERLTVAADNTAEDAVIQLLGTNSAGNESNGVKFIAKGINTTSGRGKLEIQTRTSALSYQTALTIDENQRLLVGTSSVRSVGGGTGSLIHENINEGRPVSFITNSNTIYGQGIAFGKSRGTSLGSATIVQSGDTLGYIDFCGADGTDLNSIAATIKVEVDGTPGANDMPGRLVFSTTADGASSPTERMRIDSKGSTTLTCPSVTNAALYVKSTGTSNFQRGIIIEFPNRTPNDANSYFWTANDSSGTRGALMSNGGLHNYSANNVNLSDRNAKKDITPAAGTWDCLKAWEIVNFHYKDQPDDADLNMGVIAQQIAESCPEVVTVFQEAREATETEPAQEERIGVKDQQMVWMAIKALQEAQLRIETLEAEVAALKGA